MEESTEIHFETLRSAVTHGGKFHADDVFSTALLLILNPEIEIHRVMRLPNDFKGFAFDIGFGPFDHHQPNALVRENGVKYASFGLLWRACGANLLGEEEAALFDYHFIQPLDLDDNTGCGHPLADMVGLWNPPWDSKESSDKCFFEIVNIAKQILQKRFASSRSIQRAHAVIKAALSRMEDHIVILECFAPWKSVLIDSDAKFVVYPSQRGGYSAQAVPREPRSTVLKVPFPQTWAGLIDEKLQAVSGIADLRFCHTSCFLITSDTLDSAIKACKQAEKAFEH